MERPALPAGPWLVVGLARSGIAAGRALVAHGHEVIGVDSGAPELDDPGFPVQLGVDGVDLLDAGIVGAIVKSPGVPPRAPVIASARERGIPVLGELELGWRLVPLEVVAITGTNGKTTVAEWLGHAHRVAGVPVHVVGNVGTAYTSLIDAHDPAATVLAECSSYQLYDTLAFRPEVGAVLNLTSDHLDWHGDEHAYRAAKLDGMFSRQLPSDTALAPAALAPLPGEGAFVDLDLVELPAEPALPGEHNRANARAVTAACRARGIPEDAIAQALRTFGGVAHRLEEVRTVRGVRYVNDSKATNVASTMTALAAMDAPVHLILGGDDAKGEDFTPMRAAVDAGCASVQLIGAAAGRLREQLGTGELRETLDEAVKAAAVLALPGHVVLLSPACASFDQYRDFEARGEHFARLVSTLSG
jgi:UDP-N-acetylmuramoylalanine--D-glutamate ligase